MYNKFAFDLDGTLIDNKGNIQKDVDEFFFKISQFVEAPELLICTGNSAQTAFKTIDKINEILLIKYGVKKLLKFRVSACAGAVVYDENRKIISKTALLSNEYFSFVTAAMGIDDNLLVFIQDEEKQYYCKNKFPSKRNVLIDILKLYDIVKPFGNFHIVRVKTVDYYTKIKNGEILSIHLFSLSHDKMKEMQEELSKKFPDYTISIGTSIQIARTSKLSSIKYVYGEDLSDVVYVGDGYNDIIPLTQCGISFGVGEKDKVLQASKYAVKDFNTISNFLFKEKSQNRTIVFDEDFHQ